MLDRGTSNGNLNLSYGRIFFDYLESDDRTTVAGVARHRTVTEDQHGDNYKIGGDYEFGRCRLEFIGLGRGKGDETARGEDGLPLFSAAADLVDPLEDRGRATSMSSSPVGFVKRRRPAALLH